MKSTHRKLAGYFLPQAPLGPISLRYSAQGLESCRADRCSNVFAAIRAAFGYRRLIAGIYLGLLLGSPALAGNQLDQQRVDFTNAESALKAGNWQQFERLSDRLEDYILFPLLRYQALRNRFDNSSAIERFLRKYEGTRYAKLLRKRYLRFLSRGKHWRRFLQVYQDDDDVDLQCGFHLADYFTGNKEQSMRKAKALWLSGVSRPDDCDPLFDLLKRTKLYSAELIWQRFQLALDQGQTGLARYLAKALEGNYRRAADFALRIQHQPLLIDSCQSKFSFGGLDGWLFAYGVRQLAGINLNRALRLWANDNKDHSIDRETRGRTRKRLAMLAALRRHPLAYSQFEALEPEHGDEETRSWRIRAALMDQRWGQVLQSIKLLPSAEKQRLQWKYWHARALQAQGNKIEAQALYREIAKERDYYGFLAADRLQQEYQFSDHPVDMTQADLATLERQPDFAMVKELIALGRKLEAKRNWWHMIASMNRQEKIHAAKIAQRWGLHQIAIFTAAKARYWDDLDLRFPIMFVQPIIANAEANSLAPSLVFGLVRQESVFETQVVSNAGAIGLMQIMPATGKQVARQLNQRWRSKSVLFDVTTNLQYGTHYLRKLLDEYGHNFAMAAAAYNAGPHRVKQWLPQRNSLPADIWAEIIPYRETRKYVRYVLGYTMVYQHRLKSGQRKLYEHLPDVQPGLFRPEIVDKTREHEFSCGRRR